MKYILLYFLLFFIYSVVGYITEITFIAITKNKFTLSRGFLVGPYLPIYGTGALIITLLLTKYKNDYIVLFFMSCIICGIIEYMTSYIMEKLFKLRWWDYTDEPFNINGRICLSNIIDFGLGGLIIVEITNPILFIFLKKIPISVIYIISIICIIIMITDYIISIRTIINLEINITNYTTKDSTSIIKEEVRKSLSKYSILNTRLINAFPNINLLDKNNKNKIKEIKEIINKSKIEYEKIKKERKLKRKNNR